MFRPGWGRCVHFLNCLLSEVLHLNGVKFVLFSFYGGVFNVLRNLCHLRSEHILLVFGEAEGFPSPHWGLWSVLSSLCDGRRPLPACWHPAAREAVLNTPLSSLSCSGTFAIWRHTTQSAYCGFPGSLRSAVKALPLQSFSGLFSPSGCLAFAHRWQRPTCQFLRGACGDGARGDRSAGQAFQSTNRDVLSIYFSFWKLSQKPFVVFSAHRFCT